MVSWNEMWISWLNDDFNFIKLSETLRLLMQRDFYNMRSFPKVLYPGSPIWAQSCSVSKCFHSITSHFRAKCFNFHSLLVLETGTLWLFTLHICGFKKIKLKLETREACYTMQLKCKETTELCSNEEYSSTWRKLPNMLKWHFTTNVLNYICFQVKMALD